MFARVASTNKIDVATQSTIVQVQRIKSMICKIFLTNIFKAGSFPEIF